MCAFSDVPLVSLSLADLPPSGNAKRVEVAEADGAEVRMRCTVDANPTAHAVKWFRDVSRTLSLGGEVKNLSTCQRSPAPAGCGNETLLLKISLHFLSNSNSVDLPGIRNPLLQSPPPALEIYAKLIQSIAEGGREGMNETRKNKRFHFHFFASCHFPGRTHRRRATSPLLQGQSRRRPPLNNS